MLNSSMRLNPALMVSHNGSRKVRVLLVDNLALHSEAMRLVLEQAGNADVLYAATEDEACFFANSAAVDIALVSLYFCGSSSLHFIRRLLRLHPALKIVAISERPKASYASSALAAGAAGYISLSSNSAELLLALDEVSGGKIYIDPEVAALLALGRVHGAADICDDLTRREVEVLNLLGEGKGISEIANRFGLAYKTVANTCSRLRIKLKVKSSAELLKIAYELRDD